MNLTALPGPLEPRRLVNRTDEMNLIRAALGASDTEPRVFYFQAEAGIGKTKLLKAIIELVKHEYADTCRFGGFLDFGETELHSNSGLEKKIADELDPERNHFEKWRDARREYAKERRLAPPGAKLEDLRRALGGYFVEGLNEFTNRKLLLCFDTLETLQYEGDVIQSVIGEIIAKDSIETLGWLTTYIPQMQNVVVVFAGREKKALADRLNNSFANMGERYQLRVLQPFKQNSEQKDVQEYLQVMAETFEEINESALAKQMRARNPERLHTLTGGRPILLSFVTDILCYRPGTLPAQFDPAAPISAETETEKTKLQQQIKDALVTLVMNIDNDVKIALPDLALARKGVTPELFRKMMAAYEGWGPARADETLAQLQKLSYAKPVMEKGNLVRLFIHDELYDAIGEKILARNPREVAEKCKPLIQYYDDLLAESEKHLTELADKISSREKYSELDKEKFIEQQIELNAIHFRYEAERLYYQLEQDPQKGYIQYSETSDRAIINHQTGLDMLLRDEMLRYFDFEHPDNWHLVRARNLPGTQLTPERIGRGAGIRWVQRLIQQGRREQAIQVAQRLQTDPEIHAKLRVETDPLFVPNLRTYEGEAQLGEPAAAIETLNDAIKQFETLPSDITFPRLLEQLLPRHLGRAYNNRGYAYARLNSYRDAVDDYRRALPRLRETGLPQQIAGTTTNLAFANIHIGRLLAAENLCREAIKLCNQNRLDYQKGLALNTLARVDLAAERPHRALGLTDQALEIFKGIREGGDRRGMGLVNLVRGKALRRVARLGLYSGARTAEFYNEGEALLKKAYETFREGEDYAEPARAVEALQELGCLYRQWALHLRQSKGASARIVELEDLARTNLEIAIEIIAKFDPKIESTRADLLNDLGELYLQTGNQTLGLEKLAESDQLIEESDSNYLLTRRGKQPADPLPQLYTILGKNSLLRARWALKQEQYEEAARQYTLASAYFDRFEGDSTAQEVAARRTYAIYRDLIDHRNSKGLGLTRDELRAFRHLAEDCEEQVLFQRTGFKPSTTFTENFNDIVADMGPTVEENGVPMVTPNPEAQDDLREFSLNQESSLFFNLANFDDKDDLDIHLLEMNDVSLEAKIIFVSDNDCAGD